MTTRTRLAIGAIVLCCAIVLALAAAAVVQRSSTQSALDAEAARLAAAPFTREPDKPLIVVTGSSTVRLWRSSAQAFPDAQVVNTGFGGSTMDALSAHYDGLIGRYAPDQVFIGSGDNDLALGRSPERVIADTTALLDRIHTQLPGTKVAIVAAKPSVDRWYLRDRYERLNAQFLALAVQRDDVAFVDVWHRLVDTDGHVRPELYIADGIHLNREGYRIYTEALSAAQDLPGASTDRGPGSGVAVPGPALGVRFVPTGAAV